MKSNTELCSPIVHRRSRGQGPLFVVAALFFDAIDVSSVASADLGAYAPALLTGGVLSGFFALAGFFLPFEFLFVVALLLADAFNILRDLGAVSLGLPILMVLWIARSWIIPALAVLIGELTVSTVISGMRFPDFIISALVVLAVLVVGLTWRKINIQAQIAEEDARRARASADATRRELARQLHDTIAKDLAHVVLLAQDLEAEHPELSDSVAPILRVATRASKRLRPMILSVNAQGADERVTDVVEQIRQMLKTRRIDLAVSIPDELDSVLSRQQRRTGSLVLRECGANILKYAPAGSRADLDIVLAPDAHTVTISLGNEIADSPVDDAVASGYGLANLDSRVESEGGTFDVTHVGTRWLVYVTLPRERVAEDQRES